MFHRVSAFFMYCCYLSTVGFRESVVMTKVYCLHDNMFIVYMTTLCCLHDNSYGMKAKGVFNMNVRNTLLS